MVIFHSYVKLPEGNLRKKNWLEVTGTMGILWLTFQKQLGMEKHGKTISTDELHDFSEGWRKTTNLLGGLEREFHFSIYPVTCPIFISP